MAIGGRSSRCPGPREHRAHIVDGDRAAERFRAGLEPVADLTVEIGQCQPANAAFRRFADFRGLHDLVPEPLGIDREIVLGADLIFHGGDMAGGWRCVFIL
jgi:hypothetical protein